ncbi:uncharacterized protein LOC129217630 [Uloborus diversus]|uniref:uncharacterized protein LOC129217630 n=1 Tax=Uloborus diversus TaxID=327109 RepID=UPI0024093B6A|nr:uncharacterized protein LOC129217630 [Uloborus diversus]
MKTLFVASIAFAFLATYVSGVHVIEKTYLASMRKAEFLKIVECISISRDPVLCAKYSHCEKLMPYRVFKAVEKCQKEHAGHISLRCTKHEPLYKNLIIPTKIFDCTVETVKKLSHPEKEVMLKFEECAKKLEKESCKVVETHKHAHRLRHLF